MNGEGVSNLGMSLNLRGCVGRVSDLNTPSPFMERGTGGEVHFPCYSSRTMPDTPRHLVCTAARPKAAVPFAPAWRNETAVALARGIVADAAPDRLPILADALEEAGCDDPQVLRHCRECPDHRPHCWVLGDLLDRPPVGEPPRMTDAEVRREVERVTGQPVASSDPRVPWNGPSPTRLRLMRAVPVVVVALVLSWFAWAGLSPPITGSQFTMPVATIPKTNGSMPAR
jgi:hypothetical protein